MTKYAKKITAKDNVVTAVSDLSAGEVVTVKFGDSKETYRCNQEVPFGHKIATTDIQTGDKVIKYGEAVGSASQEIKKGDWVHTHNVKDDYKCLGKDNHPLPGQAG
jgi:altronate dehydratase small subunit